MTKSESKYLNTALCMNNALILILEVKDFEYITVKEICKKAGVSRSTFYLHYETIADLLSETMENVNKRFLSYFNQKEDFVSNISVKEPNELIFVNRDYLRPYLQFIIDNKSVYRASFRNPNGMQVNSRYKYLKKYVLEPILEKFKIPDEFWKYYISYYIEGIMAIIKEWLNNDCRDSIETIITIIEECVRPSVSTKEKLYGG